MDQSKSEQIPALNIQKRSFLPYLLGIAFLLFVIVCILLVIVVLPQFDDDSRPQIYQAYLQDLNGDGQLDAFLTYHNEVNRILLNNGSGDFNLHTDWPLRDNYSPSSALALGDLNGDGRLDAIISNHDGDQTGLMCADAPTGYSLPAPVTASASQVLAMSDKAGDGIADAFLPNCCKGGTTYYNYKTYTNPSPCLGDGNPNAIALADLNGDSSLDAFLAQGRRERTPNQVWFNDGLGGFTDSGQLLGNAISMDAAIADINGDGYPDAAVANRRADKVWLNDGQGIFMDSGQSLGRGDTISAFLTDLDGDGDLDYFAAGETRGQVWINDGTGVFQAGPRARYGRGVAVTLGDVTGDGLPDLFVAGLDTHQVWRGDGSGRFTPDPQLTGQNRTAR